MNIGTYVSQPKPDNSLHGFGRGAVYVDGGRFPDMGGHRHWPLSGGRRGSIRGRNQLHQHIPEAGAFGNKFVGVFEFEVDAAGNTTSKTWEWK